MSLTDFNKEERKQAKRDGASVVSNSGRGFRKGDAKDGTFLIDYKFTEKKSFSLNIEAFKKHEKDSWREQRQAVIVAVFTEHNRQIAMVDWDYLKEIEEKAGMYDGLCD